MLGGWPFVFGTGCLSAIEVYIVVVKSKGGGGTFLDVSSVQARRCQEIGV